MDDADMSDGRILALVDEGVAAASRAAAGIPTGTPGECDLCGEWCGRLVQGACARCRDRWNLK